MRSWWLTVPTLAQSLQGWIYAQSHQLIFHYSKKWKPFSSWVFSSLLISSIHLNLSANTTFSHRKGGSKFFLNAMERNCNIFSSAWMFLVRWQIVSPTINLTFLLMVLLMVQIGVGIFHCYILINLKPSTLCSILERSKSFLQLFSSAFSLPPETKGLLLYCYQLNPLFIQQFTSNYYSSLDNRSLDLLQLKIGISRQYTFRWLLFFLLWNLHRLPLDPR